MQTVFTLYVKFETKKSFPVGDGVVQNCGSVSKKPHSNITQKGRDAHREKELQRGK